MNNYYVTHKAGYLKQLEALERSVRDVSARYIARDGIDPIMKGAGRDFERFLPQLPYIGGKANRLIKNLIGASYKMKLFPHLEKEGLTIKEIGKLNYEINYEFFNKIPRYKKWLFKHFVMTAGNYKKGAARSQQRRYPGDWVYEYVEGDGTDYDFGVNYTECGIVKIYRQYGMEHYLPIFVLVITLPSAHWE